MPVTPNMNLNLPTPTETTGPEWAEKLNTSLETVDDHDHSSGKGKKITPAGMDINADLNLNEHSLLEAKTVNLKNLADVLSGVDYTCTLQFVDGNFYIVNSGGVAVQITDGENIKSTTVIPSSPLMPAGTVLDFAGSVVPPGFLACDGSLISRSTYSDLFNAIGTTWGSGDGATTFQLPNTSGKTSVGSGTYSDSVLGSVTRSLGQGQEGTPLGASAHALTESQMPRHTHVQNAHQHNISQLNTAGFAGGGNAAYIPGSGGAELTGLVSPTNQYTGGLGTAQSASAGDTHNNMQPSIVFNKIIKY